MKKKTGLFALLLLVCLMLSGCHGKNASSAFVLPDRFDTDRTYEISFWAKNDTNMTQVQIYKDAIAGFEAAYPNVKVNLRLYTDYGRIYNDVITNIATNTTPNVCITYPDHIATYLTGENQVVPMDALFFDKEYGLGGTEVKFDAPTRDEIIPKFLEECAFNGHYYAVPYMRSSEVCYINKTFVERLGYTLPEKLITAATDCAPVFLFLTAKKLFPSKVWGRRRFPASRLPCRKNTTFSTVPAAGTDTLSAKIRSNRSFFIFPQLTLMRIFLICRTYRGRLCPAAHSRCSAYQGGCCRWYPSSCRR